MDEEFIIFTQKKWVISSMKNFPMVKYGFVGLKTQSVLELFGKYRMVFF